jgi:hypothetical protein
VLQASDPRHERLNPSRIIPRRHTASHPDLQGRITVTKADRKVKKDETAKQHSTLVHWNVGAHVEVRSSIRRSCGKHSEVSGHEMSGLAPGIEVVALALTTALLALVWKQRNNDLDFRSSAQAVADLH